ncbi:MAG: hypothetical protein JXR91_12160 [Deltaproteobacteria bacterium]|nr:hypothetical protein [Deltaproteobacteria bacterium]
MTENYKNSVPIRAYERTDLHPGIRLPSLAKRFSCLIDAKGINPWNPETLYAWVKEVEDTASRQGGLLILGLAKIETAEKFDLFSAMESFIEQDRQMLVNLMKIWHLF